GSTLAMSWAFSSKTGSNLLVQSGSTNFAAALSTGCDAEPAPFRPGIGRTTNGGLSTNRIQSRTTAPRTVIRRRFLFCVLAAARGCKSLVTELIGGKTEARRRLI